MTCHFLARPHSHSTALWSVTLHRRNSLQTFIRETRLGALRLCLAALLSDSSVFHAELGAVEAK